MSTAFKLFSTAKATAVLYRMAIINGILYFIVAAAFAIQTALAGVEWELASKQTKFMITVGIIGTVATAMKALISDAMSKITKGELPFVEAPPAPGTIVKETTVSSATTTTPPATQ